MSTDAAATQTTPDYIQSNANYLFDPLFKINTVLRLMKKTLRDVDFDTLVGTGLSGCLVVPLAARALNKRFMLVRKEDGSHSWSKVEGRLGRRWIFVDDFISSGQSFGKVAEAIYTEAAHNRHKTSLVGTYMYVEGRKDWSGKPYQNEATMKGSYAYTSYVKEAIERVRAAQPDRSEYLPTFT